MFDSVITVISELSSDFQVTKVMQCFAQLRQLTKIRFFLSHADSEKVLHAFITSRLKYCNTFYSGIRKWKTQRLLLIQTSATRLLTTTNRSDHISPVLTYECFFYCLFLKPDLNLWFANTQRAWWPQLLQLGPTFGSKSQKVTKPLP